MGVYCIIVNTQHCVVSRIITDSVVLNIEVYSTDISTDSIKYPVQPSTEVPRFEWYTVIGDGVRDGIRDGDGVRDKDGNGDGNGDMEGDGDGNGDGDRDRDGNGDRDRDGDGDGV